jgi:hypothetical protein
VVLTPDIKVVAGSDAYFDAMGHSFAVLTPRSK